MIHGIPSRTKAELLLPGREQRWPGREQHEVEGKKRPRASPVGFLKRANGEERRISIFDFGFWRSAQMPGLIVHSCSYHALLGAALDGKLTYQHAGGL
jgi:hypothetical protein